MRIAKEKGVKASIRVQRTDDFIPTFTKKNSVVVDPSKFGMRANKTNISFQLQQEAKYLCYS